MKPDLLFLLIPGAMEGKAVEYILLASALREVNLAKNRYVKTRDDLHRQKQTNALFCGFRSNYNQEFSE
ncbi:hypothetical protein NITHO_7040001 [Nitrolancea hollandica Lb]|uniref:Uncharacterized protein n=1 Tax=Nitrolancea hollandica Lb TaxID=1129897 RepID=I4EN12_9BACT|nr:hypothetical protein NITHO_7040001 [Nitrolancea hollandica Lb]